MGVRRVYVLNDGRDVLWRNLRDGELTSLPYEEARRCIVGRAGWIRGSIEDGTPLILR